MGSLLSCPDLQRLMANVILVGSLSFVVEFVVVRGNSISLVKACVIWRGKVVFGLNHKWELCDCVLHFMFSHLT